MDEEATPLQHLASQDPTDVLLLRDIAIRMRHRKRSAPTQVADMSAEPEQIACSESQGTTEAGTANV